MDGINLVDLMLNQGPAFLMAAVFAYLFMMERKENAHLNRVLRGTLREMIGLPDENHAEIATVETMDIP